MKLFNESFANISNFQDIKREATFMLLRFFTAKDLIDANYLLLNSTIIFVFLGPNQSVIF